MVIFVMTLLLPYFFQETGAEDQAGKFKKNALPQNTATDGIYQKSTTFQHLKKSHIQHLSPTNSSCSLKIKRNFTQYQHAFHTTKITYSFFCFVSFKTYSYFWVNQKPFKNNV